MNDRKNNSGIPRRITRRRFLFGGAAAGAALLGDGVLRQPEHLEIRETRLPNNKLASGQELRIVHLSDLHLRRFGDYDRRVADTARALRPDLIILTGDYLEEERELSGVLEFLDRLEAPGGVYAVQGNWEYWAMVEGEGLRRQFAEAGTRLLINERLDCEPRGIPVSLFGLDFPSSSVDLRYILSGAGPGRVGIVLSHVPEFEHRLLDGRVDLVLCGHTHGGQVRLPFLPPFHLPRHSGRFVDGLYRVAAGGVPLYVSRGIGTSVLPIRLFCRPEIALIRLYGA